MIYYVYQYLRDDGSPYYNIGRKDDGRGKKADLTKSRHKWYNNGVKTIMVEPGKETAGYVLGRRVGL